MYRIIRVLALLLATAAMPAQMAGTYLVNQNGGSGVFDSIQAAVAAMFLNGVGGPIELALLPGVYAESVLLPPLPGASAVNTVRIFAAVGPGTVQLTGAGGDTFALCGLASARNRGLIFDGLDFVDAAGHAISSTAFVDGVEIRNCTFGAEHRGHKVAEWRDAIIATDGSAADWHVHHNRFTLPSHHWRQSCGIYYADGGGWSIHDNAFDLNGGDCAIWLLRDGGRPDAIYDNLFAGALHADSDDVSAAAVIRADLGNDDNDIAHNTFLVTFGGGSGCCIASAGAPGLGRRAGNRIHGNLFALLQGGTCLLLRDRTGSSDGNLFWAPGGAVGRLDPQLPGWRELSDWQLITGFDQASVQQDPQLLSTARPPFDLHPLPTSPVRNAAVGTPPFIGTDFDGRLRDHAPDIGAYESTSFAIFGSACIGSGGLRPILSGRGTVAIGATDFVIELANAQPNAYAVLIGGDSRREAGSMRLPFDLGGGCALLTAPLVCHGMVAGPAGTAVVPMPIPYSGGLVGANLYFQWLVFDPGSGSRFGVVASQAGALQM